MTYNASRNKTILYLRTDLVRQELIAGGSVSHTVGVLQGFIDLGYTVVCASSCMETVLEKMAVAELKMLRLPAWLSVLRWKISCLLSTLFFAFQLLPLFKNYSFSCIYQRYSVLNATGIFLSAWKKIPLILEYNGSELWVDKHWSPGRWFKLTRLISWMEKINLHHATTIVVVSQVLKDDLVSKGIPVAKILVNPNGVDTTVYDPEKLTDERARIRKELKIEEKFVFGFIGTFSPWHGIELLAAMIPQLLARNTNVHFLLIGNGPLQPFIRQELQAIPASAVTFIDTVPAKSAREYLAACDAFLCPTQPNPDGSPFFGSPTKMFEYMSMGKPIIASDLEQLRELLCPAVRCNEDCVDGAGFLTAPTSPEFVRTAQHLLMLDEQQRKNIGANARKKAVAQYTWTRHVNNILEFSHEL